MSEAAKRRIADPVAREEFLKRVISARKPITEETRQRMREAGNRRYEDPAQREISRQLAFVRWQNPAYRAKLESARRPCSPELRKKYSEASKRMWADPVLRERIIARVKEGWAKKRRKSSVAAQVPNAEDIIVV